jgi:DNA end-binding protein Ku
MSADFIPEQYHESYRERLEEAIYHKIEGQEIIEPPQENRANVVDLMDALRKSIRAAEQKNTKKDTATTAAAHHKDKALSEILPDAASQKRLRRTSSQPQP